MAVAATTAGPYLNRGRYRLWADDRLEVSGRAIDLVTGSTVIDMLGLLTLDWPRLFSWHRDTSTFGERDFERLRATGIDVFHPAVETGSSDPHRGARKWLAGWHRMLSERPDAFVPILAAKDLPRPRAEGKVGLLLGFQNSDHFRTVDDVAYFHRLGQRVSQLTYDKANRLGGGCRDTDPGLTPFGAEVIGEMNRLGMAIDLSHCGERTTLEAIERSRRPVLVTHSNSDRLVPGHPRCKSDRVLRALAKKGGVMGITFLPAFVRPGGGASLSDVLDHFEHVARRVGVEHVGVGSDFDVDAVDPRTGRVRPKYELDGVEPARRTFALADGLLARGWSEGDVVLALGGNFARALDEIWA
jgi:membrane dipeptidase